MNIIFYKFTKRKNSTKLPPVNTGTIMNCELKDETSFLNPVIKVSNAIVSGTFSPDAFNYVYVPYWDRYYYITDWEYVNAFWQASCIVDPLASFKTAIGNTSAYIIRCDSQYNGDIIDTFYPATSVCGTVKQQFAYDFIYQKSISEGCFVVGIINSLNNAQFGAVTYYVLTLAQLSALLNYLFSSNIYSSSSITEIGEGLYKSLFNPFQYIVSCMWLPWAASVLGNTTAQIRVGYWDTGVTGIVATTLFKQFGYYSGLPLNLHPQWQTRGFYLNKEPYSKYTVYIPPFGMIPIDTAYIKHDYELTGHGHNYLHGYFYCDCITGIADLYLAITDGYGNQADNYQYFTMRTAQIGVPVQLAQIMSDYLPALSSGVNAIGSLATFNIPSLFGNIANAVQSAMPKVSVSGTNGSLSEVAEPPLIICEHYQLVDENRTEFGRPLCATKTINTLSGYIKTGEADHAFPCTKTEAEEINRTMQEGFFYE